MGFLKRLFGLEPKSVALLSARIATDDDFRYFISFSRYQPKLQPMELVRLALHYYAEILFSLNHTNADKPESALILKNMMQAVLKKNIHKDSNIMRDAGIHTAAKLVSSDPPKKSIGIVATLFFIDKMKRRIAVDLPRKAKSEHLIYSVMALIHATLIYLDKKSIDALNRSLSDMNEVYDSGQSFSDIKSLTIIPTKAFISALKTG